LKKNPTKIWGASPTLVLRVAIEGWMASILDEMALSRLASNHTGTWAHLQRINFVQDTFSQCAMGYDTIDHGLWECGLHSTLINKLQQKLQVAGIDHDSPIRDILTMRNMVALKLIFEYSKDIAHLVKYLRISSGSLDTGSNPNRIYISPLHIKQSAKTLKIGEGEVEKLQFLIDLTWNILYFRVA
jgi:hypothetical protein